MIVLLDNYDSFTYNLFQYMIDLGAEVNVFRNDEISIKEIQSLNPEKIVCSKEIDLLSVSKFVSSKIVPL